MNILAVDPGKTNLAWALLTNKGKILEYDLITHTFDALAPTVQKEGKVKKIISAETHMRIGVKRIKKVLKNINSKLDEETNLVYERFIPRGRFNQGNLSEIVSMVIGQFVLGIQANSITPYMAATWKVHAKKHYSYTDNMCKDFPQHIIDAVGIGLYRLEKLENISKVQAKKNLQALVRNHEKWKLIKGVWTRL